MTVRDTDQTLHLKLIPHFITPLLIQEAWFFMTPFIEAFLVISSFSTKFLQGQ